MYRIECNFSSEEQPTEVMEKWGKRKVINHSRPFPDMLNETREILRDFYEPYNRRLAALLNDDAYLWKTTKS